jgi:hypothetical protein
MDKEMELELDSSFIYDPSLVLYLPLYKKDGGSFCSEDAYGHLCTDYGALWVPQGRTFDGTDDYIDCSPAVSDGKLGNAFTWICWGKLGKWDANQNYIGAGSTTNGNEYMGIDFLTADKKLYARTSKSVGGVLANVVGSTGTYNNDSTFHFLAVTVDADGHINHFIIDTVDQGNDSTNVVDASSSIHLYIGQLPYTSANINSFKGTDGEVLLYTRELSLVGIEQIRLATKWRYQ